MSTIQNSFQRVEQKYLLTGEQYGALRRGMAPYVKPDVYSHYTICSIYCDTEDFAIVRNSLDKPVYKEKLRLRSYGVPGSRDTAFVELKKKFDGVVYKRRVTVTAAQAAECVCTGRLRRDDQISREINWFLHTWKPGPAAFIGYDREAWSGIASAMTGRPGPASRTMIFASHSTRTCGRATGISTCAPGTSASSSCRPSASSWNSSSPAERPCGLRGS